MSALKLDFATLLGVLIALGGILGGLLLEGGNILDVSQSTAALIVLGGTLGAVMITCPMAACRGAARKLPLIFYDNTVNQRDQLAQVLLFASRARQKGIASLDADLESIANPFFRKALELGVDGIDTNQIREIMQIEMDIAEQDEIAHARVFEAAGGYAPTIGIIGAVLGLIQVMKHLGNIDEVGKGIAVAFVATAYGVGIANLFLLPAAGKIRSRIREEFKNNEMLLEGVCGIVEGVNPRVIARKLEPFVRNQPARRQRVEAARQARAGAG